MTLFIVKLLASAAIVAVVSETAKRSGYWGGVIASLPLVSILALTWLYFETRDAAKVATLARSTIWFVLPSLPFFLILAALLSAGRSFAFSMLVAVAATAICYVIMAASLKHFGVSL